ncbi:MAG: VCBS repeat-containing protein [Phycisphaeraceae bacterium]|nr:VCBS repeat-containing protein [Phycisphaerales bacterium]MCB9859347.1 VCBS repeat-containing protein [Phycisphaeraceae bacterium]
MTFSDRFDRVRRSVTRVLSRSAVCAAIAGAVLSASSANATWSIVIVNTRTGEVAVGSATCLSNFDLRAASPMIVPGYGAGAAQSFVENTGFTRVILRDAAIEGLSAQEVFDKLAQIDTGHQTRQYGYANVFGEVGNFSGDQANEWKGGVTGQIGDIVYSVQGNILTGEPVVTAAAAAIEQTDGSIADRLMAGMQAARSMGGDGRCSCSSSAPMSCGSPPASFVRSASTGYMMVARAGDTVGCNGLWPLPPGAASFGLALADFNNDGLLDMVAPSPAAQSLAMHVFFNTTQPHSPVVTMETPAISLPVGQGAREVATADFNSDGNMDIVCTLPDSDAVGVFFGNGNESFSAMTTFATLDGPMDICVGDFDGINGPDIAVGHPGLGAVSVLMNNGNGSFGLPSLLPAPNHQNIVAADIDGDSDLDILHNDKASLGVRILSNNGNGGFAQGALISGGIQVDDLAVGDFDGSGEPDVAMISITQRNVVLSLQEAGAFQQGTPMSMPTSSVQDIAVGDINGDGNLDAVVVGAGIPDAMFLYGDGNGNLNLETSNPRLRVFRVELADMDNDGDNDIVGNTPARIGLAVADNVNGTFAQGDGCATGSYYLNLNSIDSTTGPDIVETLQTQFDDWKDSLVGRPDAIRTTVEFEPPVLNASTGSGAVMTINVKDANSVPVLSTTLNITIEHAPTSAMITTASNPFPLAPGVYKSLISTTGGVGTDEFIVTIDDGIGLIVLMPNPKIVIDLPICYADCDSSGTLNIFDYICFGNAYSTNDPRADCDQNGVLNIFDYICFGNAYAAGCP